MPGKSRKEKASTPVESVRHKDKRANIPTNELRDFVPDDAKAPETVLYGRTGDNLSEPIAMRARAGLPESPARLSTSYGGLADG